MDNTSSGLDDDFDLLAFLSEGQDTIETGYDTGEPVSEEFKSCSSEPEPKRPREESLPPPSSVDMVVLSELLANTSSENGQVLYPTAPISSPLSDVSDECNEETLDLSTPPEPLLPSSADIFPLPNTNSEDDQSPSPTREGQDTIETEPGEHELVSEKSRSCSSEPEPKRPREESLSPVSSVDIDDLSELQANTNSENGQTTPISSLFSDVSDNCDAETPEPQIPSSDVIFPLSTVIPNTNSEHGQSPSPTTKEGQDTIETEPGEHEHVSKKSRPCSTSPDPKKYGEDLSTPEPPLPRPPDDGQDLGSTTPISSATSVGSENSDEKMQDLHMPEPLLPPSDDVVPLTTLTPNTISEHGLGNGPTASCFSSSSTFSESSDDEAIANHSLQKQKRKTYLDLRLKIDMWAKYLNSTKAQLWVAPVNYFKHAPFSQTWTSFARRNSYCELRNPITETFKGKPIYWIGKVSYYIGYKACVIFVNVEDEPNKLPRYTWVNYGTGQLKPMGFALFNKVLLWPIVKKIPENFEGQEAALEVYKKIYKNEESVPVNHRDLVVAELEKLSSRFKLNEIVEALSKDDCGEYRLSRVTTLIGDRLHIQYLDEDEDDEGFWFSQHSHSIHKAGWCRALGIPLTGDVLIPDLQFSIPDRSEFIPKPQGLKIKPQMIFEMRHPVLTHKICAGYVSKVFKHGYFLAGTDWTRDDEHCEAVLHATSDYIFPINFCFEHGIEWEHPKVPKSYFKGKKFSWEKYMVLNQAQPLDLKRVDEDKRKNPFTKGCKLEAVQVVNPVRIKPATVVQQVGRLMKIHFDGKSRLDKTAFQWVSCDSSNIYPVGYAEMVCHRTEGLPCKPMSVDHYDIAKD